ncbi:MAG: SAM-dependent methyltransferase [Streptosporangiales bacterium]|nr:SAM-dependent methyltransferase [Streptosporangiales bacterium]
MDLKTEVPHAARIYDYLLGGKTNFPADRAAAEEIVRQVPGLPISMRANRDFVRRVAKHAVTELGLRQFLDIGTGLPTPPNMHEVVQAVAPESRVVYVDNDPIVLTHARALLTSTPQGRTAYVNADLRDPQAILDSPQVRDTLDMSRPVLLSVIAILQFIPDQARAREIVSTILGALPAGSALAVSTVAGDLPAPAGDEVAKSVRSYNAQGIPTVAYTRSGVEALFAGLDLVDPGVTLVNTWNLDEAAPEVPDRNAFMYCGLAVKP